MSDIRNLAIVLVAFGFGWWLLNRQAQIQQQSVPTSTSTSTPTSRGSTPLMDRKYGLTPIAQCPDLSVAQWKTGKGMCITAGTKSGIAVSLPNGKKCTLRCDVLSNFNQESKKQMGIDKCKCNAINREDMEKELVNQASYAAFRVTIA